MSKIRRVVQLLLTTQLSNALIAQSAGVSRNTVHRYAQLSSDKGYLWEDLKELGDDALDAKFNKSTRHMSQKRLPDFSWVHQQLHNSSVTLELLWEEYRIEEPANAYSYSQFTELYRQYRRSIDRIMRQTHLPGERTFVDFSGRRPGYLDPESGKWCPMELFVGVLGASNLTFACCVPRQTIAYWIDAHVQMFRYFGGVTKLLVPDNLKSAVLKPGNNFVLNPSYEEMAEHYSTVIVPTRSYKPRDKAKVEGAVLIVQRWVLARLRNQQFFSAAELNDAVLKLVVELNLRPFKRMAGSRRSRYDEVERPLMIALPAIGYEFGTWTGELRVDNGYHVLVAGHWYSVPHQLVGQRVSVRTTARTVEVFRNRSRVAVHEVSTEQGGVTTTAEHQPESHRRYAERSTDQYLAWATAIGPSFAAIVGAQFERAIPSLGFPACDALRKLVNLHGPVEVEAAAARAVQINSLTVKSVRSLLNTKRHRSRREEDPQGDLPLHYNLRGPGYYAHAPEDSSC